MSRARTRARGSNQSVHGARLRRVRARLRREDCDAILVTDPNDIRYLCGFSGEDSYLLVGPRAPTIISDFRFKEELGELPGRILVVMRDGPIEPAAGALIRSSGLERIALQSESLTVQSRAAITRRAGARRVKDTRGLIAELRIVKDETEIRAIRGAVRLQEKALLATLDEIGPGWTESEIAALLEYEMTARGADGPSFGTIVAARANGSRPHHRPGRTTAPTRGPLLIDWGARRGGYCADMTRTFCFGSWPRRMREIHSIVLEAHEAAVAAARPGLRCHDLDAVARKIIGRAGYAEAFGHALGHGIGLDVHEAPRIGKRIDRTLEAGMVITIEPGIYLPGVGGVRIEDDILVTTHGARSLCSLPKDLSWATL